MRPQKNLGTFEKIDPAYWTHFKHRETFSFLVFYSSFTFKNTNLYVFCTSFTHSENLMQNIFYCFLGGYGGGGYGGSYNNSSYNNSGNNGSNNCPDWWDK